jgi:hypothetical protein
VRVNARSKRIAVASAVALLAAVGPKSAAAQAEPTAAKSCVYLPDIDHTKIVNERNILFYLRNKTILQSSFREPCWGLHEKTRFTYGSTALKRLCAGDMITLLADTSFGGVASANTCKLGMFLAIDDDEVDDLLAAANKDKGGQKKKAIKSTPVELPPAAAPEPPPRAPSTDSAAPAQPPKAPSADGATSASPAARDSAPR